uniref:Dual specificity phosphatase n=1 Tax=Ditylenchus dipsaci TaxID=166011 RepID=A0A915EG71_9BILA
MHWQKTYDFIKEAKDKGSAVLVHCKKGISRSSSTVIAYIMKEYGWSLESSLNYVKDKRNCITPNKGFMEQLMTFHGVLSASSNRHSAFFNPGAVASVVDTLQPNSLTSTAAAAGEIQKLTRQLSSSPVASNNQTLPQLLHKRPWMSIVRHKSSGTITSAKNFFGSKCSTNALSGDWTSKKRASSLVDSNTYANRGKVKQHKENFENRLKNFKGKTQTATSFVTSIAKEISRLSISMSAAQNDNTNHASLKKAQNKVKAYNNKSILEISQQHKRNVKTLVNEFERGIIVPAASDGVKLRSVSKRESSLCNENLIIDRTVFTAQVSLS